MKPMGISINRLAKDIVVAPGRISAIVNGTRAITADTALRLGKYFGVSPDLWIGLQADYDLRVAKRTVWPEIEKRIHCTWHNRIYTLSLSSRDLCGIPFGGVGDACAYLSYRLTVGQHIEHDSLNQGSWNSPCVTLLSLRPVPRLGVVAPKTGLFRALAINRRKLRPKISCSSCSRRRSA